MKVNYWIKIVSYILSGRHLLSTRIRWNVDRQGQPYGSYEETFPTKLGGFMSHLLPQRDIIYGPISSRRLGRSLGINLSSTHKKICTFDCVYCQYGPTGSFDLKELPSTDKVIARTEQALSARPEVDYITFSGNGEATMHPNFKEIAEGVKKLRDRLLPNSPISLLTNSTFITENKIQEALQFIDYPIFKLDAGDENTFHQVDRPYNGIRLDDIVSTLQPLRPFVLSTAVLQGKLSNVRSVTSDGYADIVRRSGPKGRRG